MRNNPNIKQYFIPSKHIRPNSLCVVIIQRIINVSDSSPKRVFPVQCLKESIHSFIRYKPDSVSFRLVAICSTQAPGQICVSVNLVYLETIEAIEILDSSQ